MSDTKTKKTYGNYVRPEVTKTDQLTPEEISKLLKDYKKIESIEELAQVPLNTHIRYFSVDPEKGTMNFRTGGIYFRSGLPTYIMLKSSIEGAKPWSVQIKNAVFYRIMSQTEIVAQFEKLISNTSEIIKNLKKENKLLKAELEEVVEEEIIIKPTKHKSRPK